MTLIHNFDIWLIFKILIFEVEKMLWHFSSVKLLTFFGILSCSFDFCSIYHNLVMKSSFGKSAQKKVVKDHTCPLFCTVPFNSTTILIERNVLHLEMSSGLIWNRFLQLLVSKPRQLNKPLDYSNSPHWTPLKNGSSWW